MYVLSETFVSQFMCSYEMDVPNYL